MPEHLTKPVTEIQPGDYLEVTFRGVTVWRQVGRTDNFTEDGVVRVRYTNNDQSSWTEDQVVTYRPGLLL